MTIDPGTSKDLRLPAGSGDHGDIPDWVVDAYIESYRRPRSDGSASGPAPAFIVTPAMLDAHHQLGLHRPVGESRVAVYPGDHPAGFGPALQVVTDHGGMLMDSVTVLLHRLGFAYAGIMAPVFEVRRNPAGDVLSLEPTPPDAPRYLGEAWIHVQLSPSVDAKGLAELERLLPQVLADVQQVARDAASLTVTLADLATAVQANVADRFSAPDRDDAVALLRWLADGIINV